MVRFEKLKVADLRLIARVFEISVLDWENHHRDVLLRMGELIERLRFNNIRIFDDELNLFKIYIGYGYKDYMYLINLDRQIENYNRQFHRHVLYH